MRLHARSSPGARATSLLALGALAVHELRYLLAYGGDAQSAMASQGHGYLGELTPAIVVLALSAIGGRLVAASLGRRLRAGSPRSLRSSTGIFAAALVAIFAAQELVEGAVFAGHPGGVAAVLGNGGWLAVPIALAAAVLAALAERVLAGTERVLARRARNARRRLPRPARGSGPRRGVDLHLPVATPLAFGLARRPPPEPLVS